MFGFLLGSSGMILGILYLVLSVFSVNWREQFIDRYGVILYLFQGVIAPVLIFFSGLIFLFHGWRLDPVLSYAAFLNYFLIIYFVVKDGYLFYLQRNSKR